MLQLQKKDEDSILNFYKKLIKLKKENEVFTYGTYDLLLPDDPQVYAYTRTLGKEKVLVIANLSVKLAEVSSLNIEDSQLLLNNYQVAGQEKTLILQPYEARVYRI